MSAQAVYVHFPFCVRKCAYCDFNSRVGTREEMSAYLEGLLCEAQWWRQVSGEAETVYFGGGTPTVFAASELAEVLELCVGRQTASSPSGPLCCAAKGAAWERAKATTAPAPHAPARSRCGREGERRQTETPTLQAVVGERRQAGEPVLGTAVEVTVEANPGTVSVEGLRELRAGGFNRLSVGVQSFDDDELRLLGRIHTAREAREAMVQAREAGFENVSFDLIRGLPGQHLADWKRSVNAAIELQPEHISAYGLTLEAGTPLRERVARGELPAPLGAGDPRWVEWTVERLEAAGYRRYEISSFARPGRECRHNVNYWRNGQYLGLGAGSWSYLDGERRRNVAEPADYVQRVVRNEDATDERERLDTGAALGETIMLGLRMTEGVGRTEMLRRFGVDILRRHGALIERLVNGGLATWDGERLRLTFRGMLVHNAVALEFLP